MSRISARVTDAELRPYRRRNFAEVDLGRSSGLSKRPVGENEEAHWCCRSSFRDPRVHGPGQEAQPISANRSDLAMRWLRAKTLGFLL